VGERDAPVPIRERRDLLPPAHVIPAQPMREHQCRAFPMLFVVHPRARPFEVRHRRSLLNGWPENVPLIPLLVYSPAFQL
jgi:hypothetical protein